jgi:exodeoxyribonuclease-3
MPLFKIATYNINSVRIRLPLLKSIALALKPDVICLQETKTPDEAYPFDALRDMGYAHQAFTGFKGYNGVAILSKEPLSDITIHPRCGQYDARHISAKVKPHKKAEAVTIHNIYIPAGGYEADIKTNPKFKHKLDFVDELAKWFPKTHDASEPMIIVGDLNIAPLEHDVWDSQKMQNVVSHTPIEIEKFLRFQKSMHFCDSARAFVPTDKKLYTWWSYRAADWEKADKGRRLDHIWHTAPLNNRAKHHDIFKEARKAEKPSDHIPIMTSFAF